MSALSDGSVILTGSHHEYYNDGLDKDSDLYTIKIDAGGNILWSSRYKLDDNESQHGASIGQDLNGDIFIGGGEVKNTIASFLINKYDNLDGELIWNFLDPEFEAHSSRVTSLQISPEGYIYATGVIFINDEMHFLTKKYKEVPVSTKSINNSFSNFVIAPNPAEGSKFRIITSNKSITNLHIQIFDAVGKEVMNNLSYQTGKEINLGNQPSGVYFIKIISNEKSILKKIILD